MNRKEQWIIDIRIYPATFPGGHDTYRASFEGNPRPAGIGLTPEEAVQDLCYARMREQEAKR